MTDQHAIDTITTKPSWFRAVAILALIWNILGVAAFANQMMMSAEMLAQLPQAEQDLYLNTPSWANIVFAVAVITGLIGSILLIMQNAICGLFFRVSLLAVLIQMLHWLVFTDVIAVYGLTSVIMPTAVIVIDFFLVLLSTKANKHGWYN